MKLLWIILAALTVFPAGAQTFPSKPVRIVVGFTPGGGVDIAARTLAPKLSELIGQPVIVENKPGAGTNIANDFVAKSAPDGATQHLSAELLKLKTGISIAHIPYKGTAPSLTSLLAGETDMTFANIPAINQHVKSGRLRPLASTGGKRAEQMPDVPTMKEAGVEGAEPVGNTSEEFGRILREEVARWAEVVKVSGARAD